MNAAKPVINRRKQLRVVELFSGAGLFGYAFQKEGFKLVSAYEKDSLASQTYTKNVGDHVKVCDLSTYVPEGRADVLIAGPPCQGFSSLGQRDPSDPRNNLGLIIPRWATALKASVVVIENVAGYLRSPAWLQIREMFEGMGYECHYWTLNAADFGVPQRRVRSFTFYSKWGTPILNGAEKKGSSRTSVREAFRNLPKFPNKRKHHYTLPRSPQAMQRIKLVPPGGDIRDIAKKAPELVPPSWFKTNGKIVDIWGRIPWNGVGPTIRTGFLNPSRGRFLHPEEDRPISFREAARLQCVPDHFEFVGHAEAVARQIGNAVPVKLGRAVAKAVYRLSE